MKLSIIFSLLSPAFSVVGLPEKKCRCLSGDPCWPSDSDFSQLASKLSQPLIKPVPPESACYPASSPFRNCTEVQRGTFDGNWRSDQAGSMQAPNFETYIFPNDTISACYLNTTLGFPCEQGSVPIIGVDARSPDDVQAAVKFADQHNLRLVVKNTGTARGSFLIWTHHLKEIQYNATFVPDGAPVSETYQGITLGAGVQWHEAFDAVQGNNRTVVGGTSAGGSVGAAGGWLLGGGHGAISPSYGLAQIVTADGQFLTVNSHQHPDLFWALRGGGGGTYGILTSVTYRTHPTVPVVANFFAANTTNPTTFKKLVNEIMRIMPAVSDDGWGGYTLFVDQAILSFHLAPNVSWSKANETWDPFYTFAKNMSSEGLEIAAANTAPFDSFYSWYLPISRAGKQVGVNIELGSRLIPRDFVEQEPEKFAELITDISGTILHLVAGGAVSKVDPESTAVNPAWRKALFHVTFGDTWPEGANISTIKQFQSSIKSGIAKLADATPGSGAYFNEASLYEPNPKETFFGSHYGKLKAIKQKYDPSGLFVVAAGVGSDDWDSSLNCRR